MSYTSADTYNFMISYIIDIKNWLEYAFSVTLHVLHMTGDHYTPGSFEACTVVSDDALFRDKLKHMGKCKTLTSGQRNHNSKNIV